jgi:hypothetical protein
MLFDTINSSDFISGSQGFNEVFLVIVFLILLLQLRERRVRLWTLVVMPCFMLIVTIPMVSAELSSGLLNIVFLAVGFVIGGALGAFIGSMMKVKINEKDGTMVLKGSLLAVAIWGAIIVIKLYGKGLIGVTGVIDINLLTSVFLMLTLGTMIGRRAFVYWRYIQ